MLPQGGNILKFVSFGFVIVMQKKCYNYYPQFKLIKVYRCVLELDAYNYAKQCTLQGSSQSSRPKQGENYHVGPVTTSFFQAGRRVSSEYRQLRPSLLYAVF